MTGVRHRDDASKRPGAMSTGHLAPVAASAVVGSKTAFSFGRVGDGKQSGGKESTSIHGNTSRRPGNKAAETVQRNRGKNLSLQTGSIGANIDVQTGSPLRRPEFRWLPCQRRDRGARTISRASAIAPSPIINANLPSRCRQVPAAPPPERVIAATVSWSADRRASPGVGLGLKPSAAARPNPGRRRTGGRAETTNGMRPNLCSSVGSSLMQFRHLLLSLVLALLVASPCPARADAPAAKDVATIGDCLRKQENKKGGHRRTPKRRPA